MSHDRIARGVTLIELLVAMTLMLTVIAAVYGSYTAVAQTRHAYEHRLMTTRNTTRALQQVAALLRGAYLPREIPQASQQTPPPGFVTTSPSELSWITTTALEASSESRKLWQTTLRFDARQGYLLLGQAPFIPGQKPTPVKHWERLCEGVEELALSYHDGQQWRSRWSPQDPVTLPQSIRIEVQVLDGRQRSHSFSTNASPMLDIAEEATS